ncbi:hypothetical protein RAB80_015641 [Fusarium oxysporum f. sp. vasinfectum]|nr:hypothetical protein RAB80_015641 [Fusarium oxysporum f. sp. vasinfectum]
MLPYWCHYDLLGLFLPLMGPALPNSARFNFFLPLTAVYARWCFTIGGSRDINKLHDAQVMAFIGKTGHGPPPAIFQCTWGPGQKSKVDFSLGASMGGQNFAPKQLDHKFDFDTSPRQNSKTAAKPTHSYISCNGANRKEGRVKVQGLALNPSFSANEDLWEGYSLKQIYIDSETKRDPDDDNGYKHM